MTFMGLDSEVQGQSRTSQRLDDLGELEESSPSVESAGEFSNSLLLKSKDGLNGDSNIKPGRVLEQRNAGTSRRRLGRSGGI